ncbi:Base plate wedge protein 53 [compost metagenome]
MKEDDVVRAYADKKYASFGGANGVHHYYDPITEDEYFNVSKPDPLVDEWYNTLDTDKVALQFEGVLIPITNVEFEINENEKLRKIMIIPPEEIGAFVETFERVQNGRS